MNSSRLSVSLGGSHKPRITRTPIYSHRYSTLTKAFRGNLHSRPRDTLLSTTIPQRLANLRTYYITVDNGASRISQLISQNQHSYSTYADSNEQFFRSPEQSRAKVVILAGGTAVGKSATAIRLARDLDGEIISADSIQVYSGFDIGSAKVTPTELEGVPHHLIDCCPPGSRDFNANVFYVTAMSLVKDIVARGKIPIIVGGTSMYLRWLVYGKPGEMTTTHDPTVKRGINTCFLKPLQAFAPQKATSSRVHSDHGAKAPGITGIGTSPEAPLAKVTVQSTTTFDKEVRARIRAWMLLDSHVASDVTAMEADDAADGVISHARDDSIRAQLRELRAERACLRQLLAEEVAALGSGALRVIAPPSAVPQGIATHITPFQAASPSVSSQGLVTLPAALMEGLEQLRAQLPSPACPSLTQVEEAYRKQRQSDLPNTHTRAHTRSGLGEDLAGLPRDVASVDINAITTATTTHAAVAAAAPADVSAILDTAWVHRQGHLLPSSLNAAHLRAEQHVHVVRAFAADVLDWQLRACAPVLQQVDALAATQLVTSAEEDWDTSAFASLHASVSVGARASVLRARLELVERRMAVLEASADAPSSGSQLSLLAASTAPSTSPFALPPIADLDVAAEVALFRAFLRDHLALVARAHTPMDPTSTVPSSASSSSGALPSSDVDEVDDHVSSTPKVSLSSYSASAALLETPTPLLDALYPYATDAQHTDPAEYRAELRPLLAAALAHAQGHSGGAAHEETAATTLSTTRPVPEPLARLPPGAVLETTLTHPALPAEPMYFQLERNDKRPHFAMFCAPPSSCHFTPSSSSSSCSSSSASTPGLLATAPRTSVSSSLHPLSSLAFQYSLLHAPWDLDLLAWTDDFRAANDLYRLEKALLHIHSAPEGTAPMLPPPYKAQMTEELVAKLKAGEGPVAPNAADLHLAHSGRGLIHDFDVRKFYLCTERSFHYRLADWRCEEMLRRGLLKETLLLMNTVVQGQGDWDVVRDRVTGNDAEAEVEMDAEEENAASTVRSDTVTSIQPNAPQQTPSHNLPHDHAPRQPDRDGGTDLGVGGSSGAFAGLSGWSSLQSQLQAAREHVTPVYEAEYGHARQRFAEDLAYALCEAHAEVGGSVAGYARELGAEMTLADPADADDATLPVLAIESSARNLLLKLRNTLLHRLDLMQQLEREASAASSKTSAVRAHSPAARGIARSPRGSTPRAVLDGRSTGSDGVGDRADDGIEVSDGEIVEDAFATSARPSPANDSTHSYGTGTTSTTVAPSDSSDLHTRSARTRYVPRSTHATTKTISTALRTIEQHLAAPQATLPHFTELSSIVAASLPPLEAFSRQLRRAGDAALFGENPSALLALSWFERAVLLRAWGLANSRGDPIVDPATDRPVAEPADPLRMGVALPPLVPKSRLPLLATAVRGDVARWLQQESAVHGLLVPDGHNLLVERARTTAAGVNVIGDCYDIGLGSSTMGLYLEPQAATQVMTTTTSTAADAGSPAAFSTVGDAGVDSSPNTQDTRSSAPSGSTSAHGSTSLSASPWSTPGWSKYSVGESVSRQGQRYALRRGTRLMERRDEAHRVRSQIEQSHGYGSGADASVALGEYGIPVRLNDMLTQMGREPMGQEEACLWETFDLIRKGQYTEKFRATTSSAPLAPLSPEEAAHVSKEDFLRPVDASDVLEAPKEEEAVAVQSARVYNKAVTGGAAAPNVDAAAAELGKAPSSASVTEIRDADQAGSDSEEVAFGNDIVRSHTTHEDLDALSPLELSYATAADAPISQSGGSAARAAAHTTHPKFAQPPTPPASVPASLAPLYAAADAALLEEHRHNTAALRFMRQSHFTNLENTAASRVTLVDSPAAWPREPPQALRDAAVLSSHPVSADASPKMATLAAPWAPQPFPRPQAYPPLTPTGPGVVYPLPQLHMHALARPHFAQGSQVRALKPISEVTLAERRVAALATKLFYSSTELQHRSQMPLPTFTPQPLPFFAHRPLQPLTLPGTATAPRGAIAPLTCRFPTPLPSPALAHTYNDGSAPYVVAPLPSHPDVAYHFPPPSSRAGYFRDIRRFTGLRENRPCAPVLSPFAATLSPVLLSRPTPRCAIPPNSSRAKSIGYASALQLLAKLPLFQMVSRWSALVDRHAAAELTGAEVVTSEGTGALTDVLLVDARGHAFAVSGGQVKGAVRPEEAQAAGYMLTHSHQQQSHLGRPTFVASAPRLTPENAHTVVHATRNGAFAIDSCANSARMRPTLVMPHPIKNKRDAGTDKGAVNNEAVVASSVASDTVMRTKSVERSRNRRKSSSSSLATSHTTLETVSTLLVRAHTSAAGAGNSGGASTTQPAKKANGRKKARKRNQKETHAEGKEAVNQQAKTTSVESAAPVTKSPVSVLGAKSASSVPAASVSAASGKESVDAAGVPAAPQTRNRKKRRSKSRVAADSKPSAEASQPNEITTRAAASPATKSSKSASESNTDTDTNAAMATNAKSQTRSTTKSNTKSNVNTNSNAATAQSVTKSTTKSTTKSGTKSTVDAKSDPEATSSSVVATPVPAKATVTPAATAVSAQITDANTSAHIPCDIPMEGSAAVSRDTTVIAQLAARAASSDGIPPLDRTSKLAATSSRGRAPRSGGAKGHVDPAHQPAIVTSTQFVPDDRDDWAISLAAAGRPSGRVWLQREWVLPHAESASSRLADARDALAQRNILLAARDRLYARLRRLALDHWRVGRKGRELKSFSTADSAVMAREECRGPLAEVLTDILGEDAMQAFLRAAHAADTAEAIAPTPTPTLRLSQLFPAGAATHMSEAQLLSLAHAVAIQVRGDIIEKTIPSYVNETASKQPTPKGAPQRPGPEEGLRWGRGVGDLAEMVAEGSLVLSPTAQRHLASTDRSSPPIKNAPDRLSLPLSAAPLPNTASPVPPAAAHLAAVMLTDTVAALTVTADGAVHASPAEPEDVRRRIDAASARRHAPLSAASTDAVERTQTEEEQWLAASSGSLSLFASIMPLVPHMQCPVRTDAHTNSNANTNANTSHNTTTIDTGAAGATGSKVNGAEIPVATQRKAPAITSQAPLPLELPLSPIKTGLVYSKDTRFLASMYSGSPDSPFTLATHPSRAGPAHLTVDVANTVNTPTPNPPFYSPDDIVALVRPTFRPLTQAGVLTAAPRHGLARTPWVQPAAPVSQAFAHAYNAPCPLEKASSSSMPSAAPTLSSGFDVAMCGPSHARRHDYLSLLSSRALVLTRSALDVYTKYPRLLPMHDLRTIVTPDTIAAFLDALTELQASTRGYIRKQHAFLQDDPLTQFVHVPVDNVPAFVGRAHRDVLLLRAMDHFNTYGIATDADKPVDSARSETKGTASVHAASRVPATPQQPTVESLTRLARAASTVLRIGTTARGPDVRSTAFPRSATGKAANAAPIVNSNNCEAHLSQTVNVDPASPQSAVATNTSQAKTRGDSVASEEPDTVESTMSTVHAIERLEAALARIDTVAQYQFASTSCASSYIDDSPTLMNVHNSRMSNLARSKESPATLALLVRDRSSVDVGVAPLSSGEGAEDSAAKATAMRASSTPASVERQVFVQDVAERDVVGGIAKVMWEEADALGRVRSPAVDPYMSLLQVAPFQPSGTIIRSSNTTSSDDNGTGKASSSLRQGRRAASKTKLATQAETQASNEGSVKVDGKDAADVSAEQTPDRSPVSNSPSRTLRKRARASKIGIVSDSSALTPSQPVRAPHGPHMSYTDVSPEADYLAVDGGAADAHAAAAAQALVEDVALEHMRANVLSRALQGASASKPELVQKPVKTATDDADMPANIRRVMIESMFASADTLTPHARREQAAALAAAGSQQFESFNDPVNGGSASTRKERAAARAWQLRYTSVDPATIRRPNNHVYDDYHGVSPHALPEVSPSGVAGTSLSHSVSVAMREQIVAAREEKAKQEQAAKVGEVLSVADARGNAIRLKRAAVMPRAHATSDPSSSSTSVTTVTTPTQTDNAPTTPSAGTPAAPSLRAAAATSTPDLFAAMLSELATPAHRARTVAPTLRPAAAACHVDVTSTSIAEATSPSPASPTHESASASKAPASASAELDDVVQHVLGTHPTNPSTASLRGTASEAEVNVDADVMELNFAPVDSVERAELSAILADTPYAGVFDDPFHTPAHGQLERMGVYGEYGAAEDVYGDAMDDPHSDAYGDAYGDGYGDAVDMYQEEDIDVLPNFDPTSMATSSLAKAYAGANGIITPAPAPAVSSAYTAALRRRLQAMHDTCSFDAYLDTPFDSTTPVVHMGKQVSSPRKLLAARTAIPVTYQFANYDQALQQHAHLPPLEADPELSRTVVPLPAPYDTLSPFMPLPHPAGAARASNSTVTTTGERVRDLYGPALNAAKAYKANLEHAAHYLRAQVQMSQKEYWAQYDGKPMRDAQARIHAQEADGKYNAYRAQNALYTHDGPVAETLIELVDFAAHMQHRDPLFNWTDKETPPEDWLFAPKPHLVDSLPVAKPFITKKHLF